LPYGIQSGKRKKANAWAVEVAICTTVATKIISVLATAYRPTKKAKKAKIAKRGSSATLIFGLKRKFGLLLKYVMTMLF